jgi:hypothetical protein
LRRSCLTARSLLKPVRFYIDFFTRSTIIALIKWNKGEKQMKLVHNIINLVPAGIGILQSALPVIKEVVVAIVRLIAILPFLWDSDEKIIVKINEIYKNIYGWVEKIKNTLLFIK